MIGKKRILVACGTAVATSTVVAKAIESALEQHGIQATIQQCKASEVPSLAADADLIIATTPVATDHGKPVIQTLAFLTGIGKDAVIKQIIEKLGV
ncbi:MAG: PTS sugar transporter subunit IIB [Anaerolineaceae bacterium]|jgi:PTS system galactitol-specific IIB component